MNIHIFRSLLVLYEKCPFTLGKDMGNQPGRQHSLMWVLSWPKPMACEALAVLQQAWLSLASVPLVICPPCQDCSPHLQLLDQSLLLTTDHTSTASWKLSWIPHTALNVCLGSCQTLLTSVYHLSCSIKLTHFSVCSPLEWNFLGGQDVPPSSSGCSLSGTS